MIDKIFSQSSVQTEVYSDQYTMQKCNGPSDTFRILFTLSTDVSSLIIIVHAILRRSS